MDSSLSLQVSHMNGSSPRSFRLYCIHLVWNHAVQHSQPIHSSIFLLLPIGQTRKEHSSQTVSESDSGIALETAEDVSIPNGPDLYVVFFSLFLLDASAATNWAFQWCLRLLWLSVIACILQRFLSLSLLTKWTRVVRGDWTPKVSKDSC